MLQWLLLCRVMKIILVEICVSLCDLAPIQPSRFIAQPKFSFCVLQQLLSSSIARIPWLPRDPGSTCSCFRSQATVLLQKRSQWLSVPHTTSNPHLRYLHRSLISPLHSYQYCPLIQHVIVWYTSVRHILGVGRSPPLLFPMLSSFLTQDLAHTQ